MAGTPVDPKRQAPAPGSFGYMQNPMMSGAGMPRALPQQATGRPHPVQPMFEPKPLPAQVSAQRALPPQANAMARSKVPPRV